MESLDKTLRNQLERTVKEARDGAEAGARAALGHLGVGDASAPAYLSAADKDLRRRLRIHGHQLGDIRDSKSTNPTMGKQETDRLVEEVAYEHWHRMLFARFLAENDLLMYPDPVEPVAVSIQECDDLAADEGARNGWELAARFAAEMLPEIFRPDSPVFEVELPPEGQQQLERMLAELPVEVFQAGDSLGWVYQFWQAKRKDEVNASEVKIGPRELPAVTQLFTEDYMVEFLLHNTLGAWWAGKRMKDEGGRMRGEGGGMKNEGGGMRDEGGGMKDEGGGMKDEGGGMKDEWLACQTEADCRRLFSLPRVTWDYLRFVKHEAADPAPVPSVPSPDPDPSSFIPHPSSFLPAAGIFPGWPRTAAEIRVLDPCMGSGHFLVFALPILAALRTAEEGLSSADAVDAVLRDNLFGLEIDPRCTQIAAFNLALTAWRMTGFRRLPPLNLACTGIAPQSTEDQWVALAERVSPNAQSKIENRKSKIENGLRNLHQLFSDVPTLGSLIDPNQLPSDMFAADYETLQPYLAAALSAEQDNEELRERAVAAAGMVKAAELLAGEYTLVVTNVPYLGRGKQHEILKTYIEEHHKKGKADLATAFVLRCSDLTRQNGTIAAVTPQNWLLLTSYTEPRESLLEQLTWNMAAILGEEAWYSFGIRGPRAVLLILSSLAPVVGHQLGGIDVSTPPGKSLVMLEEEAARLRGERSRTMTVVCQTDQLKNPDARVTLRSPGEIALLNAVANTSQGPKTGDDMRKRLVFWELADRTEGWRFIQGPCPDQTLYGGCMDVVDWTENGALMARLQGLEVCGKLGVAVGIMRTLPVSLYLGDLYDSAVSPIVPNDPADLTAIYEFCSSDSYRMAIRSIDQKVAVTNATLLKVPFDRAHWQKVAAEKYPNGLPEPESDDPTQWLFHGRPEESASPLQVAVARLLGYRWPAETEDTHPNASSGRNDSRLGLRPDPVGTESQPTKNPLPEGEGTQGMRLSARARELVKRCDDLLPLADEDGLVCIPAVRGEPAADRLLNLLAKAYGSAWNNETLGRLLKDAGYAGKTLETWLRDGFFAQHCELFHQRPFIWQIWDGLRDGFSILVNYHRLDRKNLETLIYIYLGDWIARQKQDEAAKVDGAAEKIAAAVALQKKLELIRDGQSPYDIFVRWKPLHQQPIGWEPDLNDGVRLNIRPLLTVPDVKTKGAGVLRAKPKIKWEKDRGKEPERPKDEFPWFWGWDGTEDFPGGPTPTGDRFNNCHYTLRTKTAARERKAEELEGQTR